MNRNAESMRTQPEKPGMVLLKCFYEYQKTVDEHTKLVLRNELEKADLLEGSWAEYMTSVDDASRRRARRRRGMIGWDGGEGRRGGRSTVCSIM